MVQPLQKKIQFKKKDNGKNCTNGCELLALTEVISQRWCKSLLKPAGDEYDYIITVEHNQFTLLPSRCCQAAEAVQNNTVHKNTINLLSKADLAFRVTVPWTKGNKNHF